MTWTFMTSASSPTRTQKKLVYFSTLPHGWHYGKGDAIANAVLDRANRVFRDFMFAGLTRTDAMPGADGEVLLTANHRGHYIGVTVETDGTYSIVHERNDEECCSLEHVNHRQLREQLHSVAREIWGTSGSFIQSTGNEGAPALGTWRLRAPATRGCRYSKVIAQPREAA